MTMDGNAAGAPRFAVGSVISTSLSVLFANVLRFLAVILAVGVPAALVCGVAIVAVVGDRPMSAAPEINFAVLRGGPIQILLLIVPLVVGMLAYALIQSALAHGALQALRNRKVGIGACLTNGTAAMPRVFLANLVLFAVMAVIGLIAFQMFRTVALGGRPLIGVVGSLAFLAAIAFVLVLTWVFVPAIVVERAGPVNCFGRSMELTKGHRWEILGIFGLILIANWAVKLLSQMLPRIGAPAAGLALDVASALFFMALSAVLAAVGYYYLRAEKEGIAIDDVVTVFD